MLMVEHHTAISISLHAILFIRYVMLCMWQIKLQFDSIKLNLILKRCPQLYCSCTCAVMLFSNLENALYSLSKAVRGVAFLIIYCVETDSKITAQKSISWSWMTGVTANWTWVPGIESSLLSNCTPNRVVLADAWPIRVHIKSWPNHFQRLWVRTHFESSRDPAVGFNKSVSFLL